MKRLLPWHAALFGLYALFRLWWIPEDVAVTSAFTHDSGYLSITARNLSEGKGFINQAHWLLFLQPDRLPIPYHNANPLYPAATALVNRVSGRDVAWSGALVSLAGHLLLGGATYALLFVSGAGLGICGWAAVAMLLFPSNFQESFAVLPDALATGLAVAGCAAVVRAERTLEWMGVGVLFGLAWLTRSTALLVGPAVVIYVCGGRGWRKAAKPLFYCALAATVTISPWLVHTARVWGTPFRSDAAFYWLQEYHAARRNVDVNQYWRSVTPPPTPGQVLREDAGGLIRRAVVGIPLAAWHWMAQLADWNKVWLALFLLSVAGGLWRLRLHGDWMPALLALAVLASLAFFSLTIRAGTLEARYLGLANGTMALLALAACWLRPVWLAVPALVFWVLLVPVHDWRLAERMRAEQPVLRDYRQAAQELAREYPIGPTVTPLPYLYTYYTGQASISPPYPAKPQLLALMTKYGADRIWVPSHAEYSLAYLYPGAPATLAPEFTVRARPDGVLLLLGRTRQ